MEMSSLEEPDGFRDLQRFFFECEKSFRWTPSEQQTTRNSEKPFTTTEHADSALMQLLGQLAQLTASSTVEPVRACPLVEDCTLRLALARLSEADKPPR
jgi:hypothetical protein